MCLITPPQTLLAESEGGEEEEEVIFLADVRLPVTLLPSLSRSRMISAWLEFFFPLTDGGASGEDRQASKAASRQAQDKTCEEDRWEGSTVQPDGYQQHLSKVHFH